MNLYSTKKEIIYNDLKKEIMNGTYEFGEKLVISRLAKRYGSSEIPVREALNMLNADKLVEFKPHTGAVVSTLSAKDIQEIFEMRIELEGLATRLANDNMNDETIKYLEKNLEDSKVSFENKDYDHFEKLNKDFHLRIYAQSNNKLLYNTIIDLWSNTKRYPSLFSSNESHIRLSIEEHEKILDALINKDSVMAENWMLRHKARAGKEILRITQNEFYKNLKLV
ncbi:GntR family transcriptional regulator [Psychrobacillus sp. NPDC093180]|uniref:GntR family transcriptional regulator n=1 Tax=Psychrobacillus sp. NPDC093180 TaxID=3364489 RepID=UPI0037FDA9A0